MDSRIVYFLLLSCASVFAKHGEYPCEGEQLLDTYGNCVDPIISRNIYVFAEPEKEVEEETEAPYLPAPKLEYNIVFVRAPELGEGSDPITVPPPQQKTIVYVLSKKGENNEPQIIEIPAATKQKPEVYYVSYAEGENPKLPGGVDLETALSAPAAGKPAPAPGTHTDPAAPAVYTPPAPAYSAVYTPPAPAAPAVYTPPAPASPAVYTPPASAAPAVYTPPAPAAPAVYTPPAPAAPAVYTPPATAPPAVYTPPAPAAPTVYTPPAPAAPVVYTPPAPAAIAVYTPPATAPQQPNYVYVQPQPQKRYVQPQNVYLTPQQGGLGHFQPLGFPTQQG